MKILIADDDVVSALMLRRTLERWGYTVTIVHDGTQALAALQQPDAPKLMILDWMMPGLDGPEVIRAVRSQVSEHYNYAILLTSRDQQGDIVAGLEAGADDYLRKPFDSDELRARLRAGQRILDLQTRLLAAKEELRIQATQDALTKLANRRSVLERLEKDAEQCRRGGRPLGVLMLDLDHFKSINDTYGHSGGDEVLRVAAERIQRSVRSYDTVGRFGGEEFLVVLPDTDRVETIVVAERIRIALASLPILFNGKGIALSCSIGAAIREPDEEITDAALMHEADMALYRSKNGGRNMVTGAWDIFEAA
ncbi:MAG: diguanylate cyclase [Myxococcota bacterium]|nr:diguanylate cyclase [Myxococcota bacterium]